MALLVWTEAARRGGRARWAATGAVVLVFCSYALWWVPHGVGRLELGQNYGEMTLSALYVGTAFAFLLQGIGRRTRLGIRRDQAVAKE
ncbi:hypothetical protein GCM10010449_71690 [Streptomyces rectiviolaceus]|uniref:Uncharacterized protein n=2 Tax=Streptomyces rectiviolaceus TaxID=332591 RepID=A0ABP6NC17_9ACTN